VLNDAREMGKKNAERRSWASAVSSGRILQAASGVNSQALQLAGAKRFREQKSLRVDVRKILVARKNDLNFRPAIFDGISRQALCGRTSVVEISALRSSFFAAFQ